jgi:diguanylate cyclase (GGDEF)-like protein
MNPPLSGPNFFSIPTITLMVMITFMMQGSLIAISARVIKAYQGVREASIATFALAASFMVLAFGPPAENPLIGYASNLLELCGFFLMYLAVCRFTEQPSQRLFSFILFPISVALLTGNAVFKPHWFPILYFRPIAGLVFTAGTALTLYRSDHQRYRVSAYLTTLPLLVYDVVLIEYIVSGFITPLTGRIAPTLSGTLNILALFALSYLWTSGFILMVSQRLQNDLNDLAMNDALTRVRNRRAMKNMLDFEMGRVDKEVQDFSILLIDIDHFKRVNDTYGHDAGDVVLKWLASTLQSNMRVQDVVARWGGEEFLVLMPDTVLDEALKIAERLRVLIAESVVELPSTTINLTFSGGVASAATTHDVDKLCKIADRALYIAKQTRNRIVSQEALPPDEVD